MLRMPSPTRGEGTITSAAAVTLALMRQQLGGELLDGLLDDARLVRVALPQGRGERLRLLERDMRRQRRNVRVGLHLEHDGLARRERLVPRRRDLAGIVAEDSFKPDELGIAREVHVRQVLRGLELRVA